MSECVPLAVEDLTQKKSDPRERCIASAGFQQAEATKRPSQRANIPRGSTLCLAERLHSPSFPVGNKPARQAAGHPENPAPSVISQPPGSGGRAWLSGACAMRATKTMPRERRGRDGRAESTRPATPTAPTSLHKLPTLRSGASDASPVPTSLVLLLDVCGEASGGEKSSRSSPAGKGTLPSASFSLRVRV